VNPQQTLERLKALGGSLSPAQRASLIAAFVAVVALVSGSAYLMNKQNYVLLFSDLDAEAAADVVSRLKTAKVSYQLVDSGKAIRVPESRADELRLEFASQGLPSSGRIGFEIFDKVSFGATEFLEQVNFRRALEGEIARTISTISEVSSARVHIATAKSSLFESRESPAKASVVLKLKNNRPLSPATARGITALVAASVEGLRAESVVLLDSYGRPLTKPGEDPDSPNAGPSLEHQLMVERDLSTKLVGMLEPVVGSGRVRVNVAARLNPASEEQTEERWDPNAAVIRSRQTTSDTTPMAGLVSGIAGSRANLPDAAAVAAAAAKPGQVPDVPKPATAADVRLAARSAETTNYEISHTTRHTIRPDGEVSRLSVAVILDDQLITSVGTDGKVARKYKPREREELQKIQNLVSAAVGIDAARGDQLTVENVAFEDRIPVEDGPAPSFLQQHQDQFMELGRIGGILLIGLMTFLMFVRPMVKRALYTPATVSAGVVPTHASSHAESPSLPGSTEKPRTIADLEGAIEAELEAAEMAAAGDRRRVPVLAKRLGGMTEKEPDQAARLVRAWLAEDRTGR
jgi:flagellar M-ring protein FliF